MFRQLRRAIRLRQLIAGIFGLTLGLLGNIFASYVFETRSWWTWLIGAALIASLIALIVLDVRGTARIDLRLQPVRTIRTPDERESIAHQGLIGMLSLYRPFKGSQAPKDPAEWCAAAKRLDYSCLDLPHSNLAPLIEAITLHASRLRHCWLISTTSADPRYPGSSLYAPVLVEYLKNERQVSCEFHYGPEFQMPLDDDAEVFTRTLDRIHKAMVHAATYGLTEDEVMGDFTGGVRGMTLAMILSRLDADRDVQMIGTHYGPDGIPDERLLPVIFGFSPVLPDG